jgi:hypothetical protein
MFPERDYLLCDSSTTLDDIDWSSGLPKVIKIHGSITNKAEMAITLRQVAAHVLTKGREKVIDRLFRDGTHDSIVVFGYSCSDQFDISPHIESYSTSPTNVLLVEHDRARVADEPIGAKKERNPFQRFHGSRLFLDTDAFVRALWESSLEEPYRWEVSGVSNSWQQLIKRWAGADSGQPLDRSRAMAALLLAAGLPKLGLAH